MNKLAVALLFLICLITVSGCDYFENVFGRFSDPEIDKKPQHVLRLYGEISPLLNLTITSRYITNNKKCKKTTNWLEGVKSNRFYNFNHPVTINNGQFEAFVDFNKLTSGFCQWKLFSIDYTITKNNKSREDHMFPTRLIRFSDDATENHGMQIECDFLKTNKPYVFLPCRKVQERNRYINFKQKQLKIDFADINRHINNTINK